MPGDAAIEAAVQAAMTHTWEEGYDRDGSHAAGCYVAYREGLSTIVGDWGLRHFAEEIATAAIRAYLAAQPAERTAAEMRRGVDG